MFSGEQTYILSIIKLCNMIGSEEQNTNCNFSSLKSELFKERVVEPQCNLQVAYIDPTLCYQLDNFLLYISQTKILYESVLEMSISSCKLNVRIRK